MNRPKYHAADERPKGEPQAIDDLRNAAWHLRRNCLALLELPAKEIAYAREYHSLEIASGMNSTLSQAGE